MTFLMTSISTQGTLSVAASVPAEPVKTSAKYTECIFAPTQDIFNQVTFRIYYECENPNVELYVTSIESGEVNSKHAVPYYKISCAIENAQIDDLKEICVVPEGANNADIFKSSDISFEELDGLRRKKVYPLLDDGGVSSEAGLSFTNDGSFQIDNIVVVGARLVKIEQLYQEGVNYQDDFGILTFELKGVVNNATVNLSYLVGQEELKECSDLLINGTLEQIKVKRTLSGYIVEYNFH